MRQCDANLQAALRGADHVGMDKDAMYIVMVQQWNKGVRGQMEAIRRLMNRTRDPYKTLAYQLQLDYLTTKLEAVPCTQ